MSLFRDRSDGDSDPYVVGGSRLECVWLDILCWRAFPLGGRVLKLSEASRDLVANGF